MNEKEITNALNMNPLTLDHEDDKALPTTYRPSLETDNELDTDLRYVRQNLYDIIEKSFGAADELRAVADQSQHPRAYEVYATMIKTLMDANKDLIDMHEKKKKMNVVEEEKPQSKTVNNNLFVGSTADLLNIMNKDNE